LFSADLEEVFVEVFHGGYCFKDELVPALPGTKVRGSVARGRTTRGVEERPVLPAAGCGCPKLAASLTELGWITRLPRLMRRFQRRCFALARLTPSPNIVTARPAAARISQSGVVKTKVSASANSGEKRV
jgi:hypothetical protein